MSPRHFAIAAALGWALAGSAPAYAESSAEAAGRAAFDLVLLRPLGLVQTVVSGAMFVPTLPIAAALGRTDELVEICWSQPVAQTFRRPLGDL